MGLSSEPEKRPSSHEEVLRQLYHIKQAIKKHAYDEAIRRAGEALEAVQNEIDWCYRSDENLPFVRNFLLQLCDTIGSLEKTVPSLREKTSSAIIKILDDTISQQEQINSKLAEWQAPDEVIGYLEKKHRARTYNKE